MYGGLNHGRIDIRPTAYRAGRTAAAAVRGRAPGAGGGCVAVAPPGRAVFGGPSVQPRPRTGENDLAVHTGPAVLLRGRAGAGCHVLDRNPERGPAVTADDATAVTAAQLRGMVEQLIAAGQWQAEDPHIVIVSDAGYDVTRLAWVLRDLPVELVGRVRPDRVMRLPKPPPTPSVAACSCPPDSPPPPARPRPPGTPTLARMRDPRPALPPHLPRRRPGPRPQPRPRTPPPAVEGTDHRTPPLVTRTSADTHARCRRRPPSAPLMMLSFSVGTWPGLRPGRAHPEGRQPPPGRPHPGPDAAARPGLTGRPTMRPGPEREQGPGRTGFRPGESPRACSGAGSERPGTPCSNRCGIQKSCAGRCPRCTWVWSSSRTRSAVSSVTGTAAPRHGSGSSSCRESGGVRARPCTN